MSNKPTDPIANPDVAGAAVDITEVPVGGGSSVSPDDGHSLSIGEKIGYGLGDTASNLYWKLFEFFQLIFYTDVFGISAGAAGTMFFVTKLFDAVNDPLVGLISDRTKTAWGRFRPYLLWGAIPFAVTGVLTFYTPDLSPRGKLIYAYITYTAVFMAYTLVNIPYGALMGVISPNPIERTSVSTYRFVLAFFGGLIVQKLTEPLVAHFGGWEMRVVDGVEQVVVLNKQAGFFWTVVCYACAAMALFVVTFLTTKERVQPVSSESSRLLLDFRDLLFNQPWMIMFAFSMLQLVAGWTRGSATAYYFTYYVGSTFGNFLVVGTIASIIGMTTSRPLVNRFGAKTLMATLSFLTAVLTAMFWLLDSTQIFWMYVLHITISFLGGPLPVLTWAMYADIADYSEWQNGRRATGLIFSAATFSQKMGGAIGAAIPGWCLASVGFLEPVNGVRQQQSSETLAGIVSMMSWYPAIALGLSAVAILFYRIDKVFLEKIQTDLAERKRSTK